MEYPVTNNRYIYLILDSSYNTGYLKNVGAHVWIDIKRSLFKHENVSAISTVNYLKDKHQL